jgi:hypothetical protein
MTFLDAILWSLGYYKGKRYWDYAMLQYQVIRGGGIIPVLYSQLPPAISMQPIFWSKTKELYSYTAKDMHEYAVTIWDVDGDVIVTPPLRGDEESVEGQYELKISYTEVDQQYANKLVSVNQTVVLSRSIKYEDLPKESKAHLLFNLHTHPPHVFETLKGSEHHYSFFSAQDIDSFFASSSALFGVITNKIELLVKPSDFRRPDHILRDEEITPEFLKSQLNIAVYEGDWQSGVLEKT